MHPASLKLRSRIECLVEALPNGLGPVTICPSQHGPLEVRRGVVSLRASGQSRRGLYVRDRDPAIGHAAKNPDRFLSEPGAGYVDRPDTWDVAHRVPQPSVFPVSVAPALHYRPDGRLR